MSKRRRNIKAKNVGTGRSNVTVPNRRWKPVSAAKSEDDYLQNFVSNPKSIILYTAVIFAGCFLIKWLLF